MIEGSFFSVAQLKYNYFDKLLDNILSILAIFTKFVHTLEADFNIFNISIIIQCGEKNEITSE